MLRSASMMAADLSVSVARNVAAGLSIADFADVAAAAACYTHTACNEVI